MYYATAVELYADDALSPQIAEEEIAAKLREGRAAIEERARGGDRRSVFEERRDHALFRLRMKNHRPTVVLAALDDVDFVAAARAVEARWSVLGLELRVRTGLPGDALRVAVSVRPNLGARVRPLYEGVVLRDSSVIVQPQRLAGERIQSLRQLPLGRVARRDVELAVGAEPRSRPRVVTRRRDVLDDDQRLGERASSLAESHDAHALTVAAIGVSQIEVMIALELRVQRQIHQATLLGRRDLTNRRHRLGTQPALFNHTHTSGAFGDEDASVGGEGDGPRDLQIGGDHLDSELHRLPIFSPRGA